MQKDTTFQSPVVLIYDGRCPVCSGTVKWIEKHEQGYSFRMIACQSETLGIEFPNVSPAECLKAMHLVLPNGTVLVGEQALPEIFKRLKRYWPFAVIFNFPGMKTLSGFFYRWFAKYRYQIAGFFHFSFTKNK
jgi:predicted DCC family thiol-disulfide oxidoreductase YuxK